MPNPKTPALKKPNSSATEIKQAITNAKNILINMDTRFDFDAVCSVLLFQYVLKNNFNKDSTIIFSSKLKPDAYKLLDVSKIIENTDISQLNVVEYDLIIALDSGDGNHISVKEDYKTPEGIEVINIDHHKGNDYFGDKNYVSYLASNTSNLYKLFTEMGIEIDKHMGRLIALGLLTDSAFFMLDTVTSFDFRVAADLKDLGVDFDELIFQLTSNEPLDNLLLKELVISNLKVSAIKKYAYSTVTLDELSERGINEGNTFATPSDILKRLDSVDFVFVVVEKEIGKYKLTFRSHLPTYDVSKLANAFEGGGHKGAAGAILRGKYADIESAVAKVLDVLDSILS